MLIHESTYFNSKLESSLENINKNERNFGYLIKKFNVATTLMYGKIVELILVEASFQRDLRHGVFGFSICRLVFEIFIFKKYAN